MERPAVFLAAALAAISILAPLPARAEEDKVFAPFVSRIRVAVKGDLVKLSWLDSPDARGFVAIFRQTGAFSASLAADAVPLAEVPYGAESYIDKPPSRGPWHYFIAATDEAGTRYDIVLPFGNATGAPVALETATLPIAPLVRAEPVISAMTKFESITAKVQGDAVVISFAPDMKDRTALLYRSASPIAALSDLLDAVIVQATSAASPFIDYPVPGIGYFYALVGENELKSGTVVVTPGKNATQRPVEIAAGRYRIGRPGPPANIRSMPLPFISMEAISGTAVSALWRTAVSEGLSSDAEKAVAAISARTREKRIVPKKPRAFPLDLEAPVGGEEYALRSIVQGPFAARHWEDAVSQFSRFLSLTRTEASEARARFYLGQSYYFSGKKREALFEFLLAQTTFAADTREWIDAILGELAASEES